MIASQRLPCLTPWLCPLPVLWKENIYPHRKSQMAGHSAAPFVFTSRFEDFTFLPRELRSRLPFFCTRPWNKAGLGCPDQAGNSVKGEGKNA